jgi:L-aspartate oxidase
MGGIVTDVWGKTTLDGLSAIGECASTGVHGANRLASNSLLEAVVFAHRVAERLRDAPSSGQAGGDAASIAPPLPADALQVLRTEMTAKAGVVRDATGLTSLVGTINDLKAQHGFTNELVTAGLIAEGALARQESRGGHYRSDFPKELDLAKRSFVTLDVTL